MYLRYSKIIYEFICLFKFSYLNMPNLKFSIAFFHRNCRLHPLTWYFVFPVSPCPMCSSAEHLNVYCQPHIFCLFMHILCILYPTFFKKTHFIHIFAICLARFSSPVAQEPLPRWCAVLPQGFHGKMRWNGGRSS